MSEDFEIEEYDEDEDQELFDAKQIQKFASTRDQSPWHMARYNEAIEDRKLDELKEEVDSKKQEYQLNQRGLSRYSNKAKLELKELAATMNDHHYRAFGCFQGALEHARKAGEALNRARDLLGKRGRWGRWRKRNFVGSEDTAQNYAKVDREWNNPELIKARKEGIKVDSIAAVLRILKNQKPKPKPDPDPDPKQKEATLRQCTSAEIRKSFTYYLKELDMTELLTLQDLMETAGHNSIELQNKAEALKGTILGKFHEQLKWWVSFVADEHHYDEGAADKRKARKRMVKLVKKDAQKKKEFDQKFKENLVDGWGLDEKEVFPDEPEIE